MIRSLVKLPSLHTSAALALALCLACGDEDGGGSDPQMMVEPQLAEGRAEAWSSGGNKARAWPASTS